MFKIFDVKSAQTTILRRTAPDEMAVSPTVQARIQSLFGELIAPEEVVRRILMDVRQRGDASLREWSLRLDGTRFDTIRIDPNDCQKSLADIPEELRQALELAASRIEAFHRLQPANSWLEQTQDGTLGQLLRPIERVGVYVPGGSAPLPSSVLMSVIPAKVAGVKQIAVCTPAACDSGKISPVILAACAIAGVDEVYPIGGAQAIAALAYGSESICPVDKIVGAGNLFVTLAKRQVFGIVGIDGLAGPTETVVIADEEADPLRTAADLLAQAEHDPLATAILLTPSQKLAEAVRDQILKLLDAPDGGGLKRSEIITASLEYRSGAVITHDLAEAVDLCNAYAPEHLNLAVKDPWNWLEKITNAGGVFMGDDSCEVMGDYIAGPSHVMPTGGSARFASPLNVWDFLKIVSLIALNASGVNRLAHPAALIADSEGLDAHALSARLRE
jgi:histidinol dehydrogenase